MRFGKFQDRRTRARKLTCGHLFFGADFFFVEKDREPANSQSSRPENVGSEIFFSENSLLFPDNSLLFPVIFINSLLFRFFERTLAVATRVVIPRGWLDSPFCPLLTSK